MTVARNRVVFGSRIIDLPLARGIDEIMLATEQALSMSLSPPTRSTLRGPQSGRAALLRILTPTLKFRDPRCPKSLRRALESVGIGYIGNSPLAAAARPQLGSIWEGTGNISHSMR